MKWYIQLSTGILIALATAACVKNKPFKKSYSVPSTFNRESNDSSALARVIMTHGIYNYLVTSTNGQLSRATLDSLWLNRDKRYTGTMVPNFLYSAEILNRMSSINVASVTGDAELMKRFADSVVFLSQYAGQAGSNGKAGTQSQTTPAAAKFLFNEKGAELLEVWFQAMLGALSLKNSASNFSTVSQSAAQAWDLAYNYMSFPVKYDPNFDYNTTPLKTDRTLALATLFYGAKSMGAGAKIYEKFKRAKASALAEDARIAQQSIDTIKLYSEKVLAYTAIAHINNIKQSTDAVAQLHQLSQVCGLVLALKYRSTTLLKENDYTAIVNIFNANFYTLIQEAGQAQINQVKITLAAAYGL